MRNPEPGGAGTGAYAGACGAAEGHDHKGPHGSDPHVHAERPRRVEHEQFASPEQSDPKNEKAKKHRVGGESDSGIRSSSDIEVKKLGRIQSGADKRVRDGLRQPYSRTFTDLHGRPRNTVGWAYVHVAIDDRMRLAYA